jgi:hypothetical protein
MKPLKKAPGADTAPADDTENAGQKAVEAPGRRLNSNHDLA